MTRRRSILALLAAIITLPALFYAGWRLGALPNLLPEPPTPEPATAPSLYRANFVIENPFPDNPALRPTFVTAKATKISPLQAADLLNASAGVPLLIIPPPPAGMEAYPDPISLHLQDTLFLEALMQLRAQEPIELYVLPDAVQAIWSRTYLPRFTWSLAGPFAFAIEHVSNQGQNISLTIAAYAEPHIRILSYSTIELKEVVSDAGNSLIWPAPPRLQFKGMLPGQSWGGGIQLQSPTAPVRSLKIFRGTMHVTLPGPDRMPTLTLDAPLTSTPITKSFQGMSITFDKPVWTSPQKTSLHLDVTFSRAQYAGDWATFTQAVADSMPHAVPPRAGQDISHPIDAHINGDSVKVTYSIQRDNFVTPASSTQPAPDPPLDSITFDLPTNATPLAVPIEFHDLDVRDW